MRTLLLPLLLVCCLPVRAALVALPSGADWRGARLAVSGDREATIRDGAGKLLFAVRAEGAEGATLRELKLEATREALLIDARDCWSRGKVEKLTFVGESVAVPPRGGDAAGGRSGKLALTLDAVGSPGARIATYIEGVQGAARRHWYQSRQIALRENGRVTVLRREVPDDVRSLHARFDLLAPGSGPLAIRRLQLGPVEAARAPGAAACGEPARLLFHAPFDGSLKAATAAGDGDSASSGAFAAGIRGKCIDLQRMEPAEYALAGNLDLRCGAISFWAKQTGDKIYQSRIFAVENLTGDAAASGAIDIHFDNRALVFSQQHDRAVNSKVLTVPNDGWNHYAVNWNRGEVEIYVNGEIAPLQRSDGYSPTKPVWIDDSYEYAPLPFARFSIGGEKTAADGFAHKFPGCIDEFRVYSAPLSAQAVKAAIAHDAPDWRPPQRERINWAKAFAESGPNPFEGAVEALPADGDWKAHGKLFKEIRLDRLDKFDASNLRTTAPITVKELNGVKYFEAGAKESDRFALNIPVPGGRVCYVEFEYPDDAMRSMDITCKVSAPDWQGSPMCVGVLTGREYKNSNQMQVHRCIVWNEYATRIVAYVMTTRNHENAALAAVRVYEIPDGKLPQLAIKEPEAVNGERRKFGIYYEDPAIGWSIPTKYYTVEGTDEATDRYMALMKYNGYNLLIYPGAWYHGLIGENYQPRPHIDGFFSAWYEKFDREGLEFVPTIGFHNLPVEPGLINEQSFENGELHRTAVNILSSGKPNPGGWHPTPPNFNLAHPETRRKLMQAFNTLLAEGKGHQSFKGIALHLTDHMIGWWGTIEGGYNDYVIRGFEKETGIKVPVDRNDPERGRLYAEWLLKNQYEEWVAWRCSVVTRFYAELAARLREARPDLKLFLHSYVTAGIANGKGRPHWQDEDYVERRNREGGLDSAALTRAIPNLVLTQMVVPAEGRWCTWIRSYLQDVSRRQCSLPTEERTFDLLKGAAFPGLGIHDKYFESDIGHRTRGTAQGLSCEWSDEPGWRCTVLNPSRFYARKHYVMPLRYRDILSMVKGGYGIGFYGTENALAPFVQAFRALPAVVMKDVKGVGDEVVKMREARVNGKYYAYVVNTGEEKRRFTSARLQGLKNLATGETLTGDTIELEPYSLVALGGAAESAAAAKCDAAIRLAPNAEDATADFLAALSE
ncbi:MAG: LamG domain-containing protein, partial [Kiritimatiellia bacterium]